MLADFEQHLDALDALGRDMSQAMRDWLSALNVHSVSFRIKSAESLTDKLARPDRSYRELWDVTDLLGLRVIVFFEDEVGRAADILESKLPLVLEHSVDKRRRADASSFGYRSVHYVCRVSVEAREALQLPEQASFEIQIRTMLEHAWAEIEHDLGYKSRDVVPMVARRRLNRLAGLLELVDQEFVAIRDELARYAETLPERAIAEGERVGLDRLSLPVLVTGPVVDALDRGLARKLGKDLSEATFHPDYLLRMLLHAGLSTLDDVLVAARRHGDEALTLLDPYFEFARTTWNFSLDHAAAIDRGYSLFFVVHAHLLAQDTLRLSKVERLANLYRALDYPDDERASQRVAGLLVDQLSSPRVNRP
jgi:ppGpp synthetase/RelA/SpoT-type nucleotidyltranferase